MVAAKRVVSAKRETVTMRMRFSFGLLVTVMMAISLAIWAIMLLGPLAHIRELAGGLVPFDLRRSGYGPAEARDFLTALGEAGRAYYANVQLRIDTLYPATYALSRGLLLWWLTMPGRLSEAAVPPSFRWPLLLMPLAAAGFDYLENANIATMLAVGPSVAVPTIANAAIASEAKSLASLLTELTWIVLAAVAARRWQRGRRQIPPAATSG